MFRVTSRLAPAVAVGGLSYLYTSKSSPAVIDDLKKYKFSGLTSAAAQALTSPIANCDAVDPHKFGSKDDSSKYYLRLKYFLISVTAYSIH